MWNHMTTQNVNYGLHFFMFVGPPWLHVTMWLIKKLHLVFPTPPFSPSCALVGILCYLSPSILHPNVLPPLLLNLLPLSSSSLAPPPHNYLLSFVYRLILLVLQSIYTYLEIKFDFLGPSMYIVRNNGWKRKLRPAELCQICAFSLNTWHEGSPTKIAFLRIRLLGGKMRVSRRVMRSGIHTNKYIFCWMGIFRKCTWGPHFEVHILGLHKNVDF